ncbi:MAG: hypothetical protein WC301_00825 [Candidatus Omnitrophota bacterium]|jgi:hypothetical protein
MKKLLLAAGLIMGFAALAYAQSSSEVARQVTAELQNSGDIAAADSSSVRGSVKTLVDSGASADEAKSIVAQAARQAKAQGLKGKELSAKVREAARARKGELEQVKKQKKEAKRKAEKESRKAKEKSGKAMKGWDKK